MHLLWPTAQSKTACSTIISYLLLVVFWLPSKTVSLVINMEFKLPEALVIL